MKKLIEILIVITGAILFASFVAGLLTLGKAFHFEDYSVFNWILFIVYYIFWITLLLKITVYDE